MGNRFPSAFFIKVVQLLIITALISVNIWLLWRIRFLFDPVAVILKTVGVLSPVLFLRFRGVRCSKASFTMPIINGIIETEKGRFPFYRQK